jgi:hypothetical protein
VEYLNSLQFGRFAMVKDTIVSSETEALQGRRSDVEFFAFDLSDIVESWGWVDDGDEL